MVVQTISTTLMIFGERLSSPDCVKGLYNCIRSVEKQMQGIHSKAKETKIIQIKSKQHLMDLNKSINFICEKLDEFERDRDEKEQIINELMENVNDMSATIEPLKRSSGRQEQYSKSNCLLIHGLQNQETKIRLSW